MMLKKENFLTELKNVELLLKYEQYSDALSIVNKLLEKYPFFTKLLLLKGRLIQLLDEESKLGELHDALDALQTAIELDQESIDALNELAMFHYAIEGNDNEYKLSFNLQILIRHSQATPLSVMYLCLGLSLNNAMKIKSIMIGYASTGNSGILLTYFKSPASTL